MLEIVETACSNDLFAFRPHLNAGWSGTCWPSDAERGTLAKEHPGRCQCHGLGNVSQEQMTLKKKKVNRNPTCWRRKAEKSLSCWNCLVSICEWLAGLLALTKIDGDHVAVNTGEGGRVPSFPTYMCVYRCECVFIIPSLLQLPVWLVPASCGDVAFPWNEECVKESVVAYTYEHMEALESRHTVCH